MSLDRRGFVALFGEPLGRDRIEELVLIWIERFGGVEQTVGGGGQVLAQAIQKAADLKWEENLQFRVTSGEQFAWVYLTRDRQVIETSGLAPVSGEMLYRDVLEDLPGCLEVIDDRNDRRLDDLEARGLM